MDEPYRVILHDDFAVRLRDLRQRAQSEAVARREYVAAIKSGRALAAGHERRLRGERLGYDAEHSDLRDCAEIKVAVVQEFTRSGRPRGPSHQMIYREFHGTVDDPRPIRQIVAFEHRGNGLPFHVAADALGRPKGRAADALIHLDATEPAIGRNKDPDRPVAPPRLPLPTDLAAALATSNRRRPGRPAESAHAMPARTSRARTVDRDRH